MLRQYETVFIASPVLSEEQMKEAVKKFRNVITDNGGEIVNEEYWGLRKLAYPIKNKATGYYALMQFKAEGECVKKLEIQYKRDEHIIRFLTVKLDKYAVEYNEKRRSLKNKNREKQSEKKEN